jgi:DNA polymerase
MDERYNQLKNIRDEIIGLSSSPLYQHRIENDFLPVVGEGNHYAKVMFIAEAPGYYEAKTGHHFQGKAGKIFDELMESISLTRKEVYITNIIKDKLPDNRSPSKEEIQVYSPFLISQIKIIQPLILVTLGKIASDYLTSICHIHYSGIYIDHGKSFEIKSSYGKCFLFPTFHPAVGLYQPDSLTTMKEDFQKISSLLTQPI